MLKQEKAMVLGDLWEQTAATNIGLDFAMLNNRLSGSLEYYSNISTDLLGSVQTDPTTGFASGLLNYGGMSNKGLDLTLNVDVLRESELKWNVRANFSYNENLVTKVEDQLQSKGNLVWRGKFEVGQPFSNRVTYNYAGLDAAGVIQVAAADGTLMDWRAAQGATLTTDDLISHGTTTAPYYGGLSSTFRYKGLDLTINSTFKFGHVFTRWDATGYGGAYGSIRQKHWANRWMKPGDELTTRIPKIAYNGPLNPNPYNGQVENAFDSSDGDIFYYYSQDHVYDAGFFRIRDIILGYTMPKEFLGDSLFKSVRLTGQITNPFLWVSNAPGHDPEIAGNEAYSNLKTVTLGIKATF